MSESQVIVITGASEGIGAEVARQAVAAGFRVVLAARRASALQEIATALGSAAHAVVADVGIRADVERIRDEAIAACGRVDVWINNAGRGIGKPVLQLTDDDIDEIIRVNVKSVVYGMQVIAPHFQERGNGHIINVSSFLSRVPLASFRSIYSAAKAAVNSLTANARTDLAVNFPDIHVSLVLPGIVTTAFGRNALHGTPAMAGGPHPAVVNGQTAGQVAEVIMDVIAHPRAEVYTNPAQHAVAQRYIADVEAFERDSARR